MVRGSWHDDSSDRGLAQTPKYLRPHDSHTVCRAYEIHENEIRIQKSTRKKEKKKMLNMQLLQSQYSLYHKPKMHCPAECIVCYLTASDNGPSQECPDSRP